MLSGSNVRLYYYKARAYDPMYGHFLQTDPIGTKDDLDLYAYVKGDPVNATDTSGQSTAQFGISFSVNINIPFVNIPVRANFQAGIAVDDKKNIAAYAQVPSSVGGTVKNMISKPTGEFAGAGLTVAVSNADTINDIKGPSVYENVSGGDGIGGTLEHFSNMPDSTSEYDGYSATVGVAEGFEVDGGVSETFISPTFADMSAPVTTPLLKPINDEINRQEDQAIKNIIKRNMQNLE